MKSPSGTLITVISALLNTALEKLPFAQAFVKFSQAGVSGGENGLVWAICAAVLSEVKLMKMKGVIQRIAITTSAPQRTTSTGSMRSHQRGRKGKASALIASSHPSAAFFF